MADEIEIRYTVSTSPKAAMQAWRDSPPPPVQAARLELVDRTLETLIYKGRYTDLNMKVLNFLRFGSMVKVPKTEAIWRLAVRFDAGGDYGTQISAIGRLAPDAREAFGRWAAEQGEVVFAAGAS